MQLNRISDPNKSVIENLADEALANDNTLTDARFNQICHEMDIDEDVMEETIMREMIESKIYDFGRLSGGWSVYLKEN